MPYALAFVYGGQLVAHGKADAGTVLNVFFAILIGSFSIAMLAPALQSISKGRAAASKLFETIDRVPCINSAETSGRKPAGTDGDIRLSNVSFHYPSRPNVPILKSLSTSFQAGKVTALVGGSGSGKSTIISLIERFYDPLPGSSIKLDGNDLRSLNLTWLRRQIGLVSQEPTLFATTVRGNVEHGLIGSVWEHASDEERLALVKSACVAANADGFIAKLPLGYDTVVGDRGMLLSGGQKQRIAIARAIVSNPRILLLDEATSALDGHSERVVQDALDKASVGRTTIVVAHRLATIRNADKILVMSAGEVVEEGTHNRLLELNGHYATLVQNQKLQEDSKPQETDDVDDDEIVTETFTVSAEKNSPLHRSTTTTSISGQIIRKRSAAAAEVAADATPMGFFAVFRRLLQMNKSYWKWYAAGTVGSVASGMVYPAMSILFGKAIADFELPSNLIRHALYRKALWYFIVAILASASRFLNFYMFARTGYELVATLRKRFFGSVLRHDIEWFDEEKNATGAVTANLSALPQNVHGLFGVTLGAILSAVTTLVGGCIIGLCYGPLLSLIGIGCIPLIISSGYIRLRVVVTKEEKTRKWQSSSAQMASEASAAVRTVASLTREAQVCEMYSKSLEEPMRISNRVAVRAQALYAASQGIMFLVIALVFYIGALWIANGWCTTPMFYTSLTSVIFATLEAGDVFQYVPDASKAVSAARAIFDSIDNVPFVDADSAEGIVLDPKQVRGNITFSNVHFRYPTRPDVRVLRDLTLDVPAGKYVALVGPSGCGKSTLIGLLERFYDPLIGRITLDGTDIRQINVASYRSQLGLVSQEPTLYTGTIRSNLVLGATGEITDEQLIQACTDANIYDFIMSLPDGFDTQVGGKGAQLSGVSCTHETKLTMVGTEAAHCYCPRPRSRSEDPPPRRGHRRAGQHERARRPGRAGPCLQGPIGHQHCAPPQLDPERRHHLLHQRGRCA